MREWLIAAGVPVTPAKQFSELLRPMMALYNIHTREDKSAFLAQTTWESTYFTELEENLWYTTEGAAVRAFGARIRPHLGRVLRNPKALANFVYADRLGNGNEASGDGWKHRGMGILQLTGKYNYAKYQKITGIELLADPSRATDPQNSTEIACAYWRENQCSLMIAAGDFDATTRAVNGKAMHGAEGRAKRYQKFLATYTE